MRDLFDQAFVLFDACRNNPFQNRNYRSPRVVNIEAPARTWIAYAAAKGEVAGDGWPGDNGVFTAAFLEALEIPGLDASQLFTRVALQVDEDTNETQHPYLSRDTRMSFVFRSNGHAARRWVGIARVVRRWWRFQADG